ncbi:polyketide synthase [Talaromyces proteolyticus]|uniref:Polyketide synthase n=1 Tax=Talaromyces proteolyticus TaxID=1131652 RepID=A0AAD4PWL2_9EURO|nr:polyketide synthase [Talaromyces proteolyticus]KAH8691644.1 polyketide synthase [Talaromyces proteolyticus]
MSVEDISKVFVLGGSVQNTPAHISTFLGKEQGPILASFLEHACRALRTEVSTLTGPLVKEIPSFSTVNSLCSLEDQGKLHPTLGHSLVCISELAYAINLFESHDGSLPAPTETLILGLGFGALAAAAICASQNLTQLLRLSIEVVRVAFHTAITAHISSNAIENFRGPTSSSWSFSVSDVTFDKMTDIINEFSSQTTGPYAFKPYISAATVNSVSISGPPAVLKEFRDSPSLQGLKINYEPVYAAYHTAHIYQKCDVTRIMEVLSERNLCAYPRRLQSVCPAKGNFSWSQTFRSMVEDAVTSLLLEPVREDLVKGSLNTNIGLTKKCVEVHSVGFGGSFSDTNENQQKSQRGIPVSPSVQSISQSKIAIVGYSGRFPDADNLQEFWDLLYEGRDVHKVVPSSRWDVKTHVDVTGKNKNTSATPYGCWLDNAGLFDAKFFRVSPREAPQIDPAQRLALMTAYEAIEHAGIVPDSTPSTRKDRVGVFYGVTSNDWMETNSSQDIDTYMIPGGNRAFIPGRVNYFFKFSGPSYSIDTACSSSLASIHAACNSLWRGDIDTAVVGGTNILTNPDFTAGLDRGHFLSRTGNCKSFDDSADGYCRGEGVVTFILKRYEDALVDKDPIHGVILSAYTNHSADAESITRPHGGAQKAILNKLLYDTGSNARDISYVEMHGTGTQAGDAEEMKSVLDVFAPQEPSSIRRGNQKLYLGSVKANIGHSEAASGVSSLAKTLLMMKNDTIPPHCGVKTKLNTKFPQNMFDQNVRIAEKPTPWLRPFNGSRKVFVNNFSAAGGNTALILEDAPLVGHVNTEDKDPRTYHTVAVSAKSVESLKGNIRSLLNHLDTAPLGAFTLPTLSYTSTARRIHHAFRIMVSGSNLLDIKAKLLSAEDGANAVQKAKAIPRPIFAFTGQGAQYPGMGGTFYQCFSSFKRDIDRHDRLSQLLGFPSILQVITDSTRQLVDYSPLVVQIATTCLEIALGRLWESWGIHPRAVVGHSLGEYAALCIAGVISEYDAIYMVSQRAQLLEQHCTPNSHAMLAVRCTFDTVQTFLPGSGCEVAAINGPEEIVLSGENKSIKKVHDSLRSHNIHGTLLQVPYAFHSSQVDPILDKFVSRISMVKFSDPKIPVICATSASIVRDKDFFDAFYFARHCRQAVNMFGVIQKSKEDGLLDSSSILVECGPQPVVSRMVNSSLGSAMDILPSLQRGQDPWKLISSALQTLFSRGLEIDWKEYHRDFDSSQKVIDLPCYSWELKEYWIQYRNDWSLHKGELPKNDSSLPSYTAPLKEAQETPTPSSKLESTTIHNVIEEDVGSQTGRIVVEADISRADLNTFVQGHKVNDIPLCTPSVYAEHALTIGYYLVERYKPSLKGCLVEVSNMVLEKALIAQTSGPQILRTSVNVDWLKDGASITYESYTNTGKRPSKHATAKICFKDMAQTCAELAERTVTVKSRASLLKTSLDTGNAYRFNRSMIYKMVGALARFDSKYTGLKEIILDSNALEAYGSADFFHVPSTGEFHTNPAFIDSLSQIGGFIMNCNDKSNLDEEVFMNHGWDSFAMIENLSKEKVYDIHASMHEDSGNKWKGDITILNGGNIVAYFNGITLQGVAKRALQYILSREQDLGANVKKRLKQVTPNPVSAMPLPSSEETPLSLEHPPTTNENAFIAETSEKVELALNIISEESGIPLADMDDNLELSELGIDSLLVLIISGRFLEELGLHIDSMAFSRMSTIKSLKGFITDGSDDEAGRRTGQHSFDYLPITSSQGHQSRATHRQMDRIFHAALEIISEESGIAVEDIVDDTHLADIGVDSLMSLIIVGRLKEELSLDFNFENSPFIQLPTIEDFRIHLQHRGVEGGMDSTNAVNKYHLCSTDTSTRTSILTPLSEISASSQVEKKEKRAAKSIIIQGNPYNDPDILFLLPDGGGSAASYGRLPLIKSGLCVIALNCPYVRHPEEMLTSSLEEHVDSYLTEIKRRQINGPYALGGWSSGGIMAYRLTQRLIQLGENVTRLVLIDSPPPQGLDRLPQEFYDLCGSVNLFDATKNQSASAGNIMPRELLAHFKSNIELLHDYYADPIPEGLAPNTTIIYATECVFDGIAFPKPLPSMVQNDGIKFLTDQRTDFSASGWGELLPGVDINIEKIAGATHFSMMVRDSRAIN